MYDVCLDIDASPETLALIGETLGEAGVNIEGLAFSSCDSHIVVHLAVEDAEKARRALGLRGIGVRSVTEVLLLHKDARGITGRPGSFGGICRIFAEHGIRLTFGYPAEHNRFVFGISDVQKGRALLE